MDAKTFLKSLNAQRRILENGGTLDPKDLARTIHQLTEIEVEAGGPYAFGKRPDFATNKAIAEFLSACGVQLPKLDAYLREAGGAALARRSATKRNAKASAVDSAEMGMLKLVEKFAGERFNKLAPDLRESTIRIISRVMHGEGRQIPLMPYYVRAALGEKGRNFDDAYIAKAGLASVCFWMATIVYDDFWDKDESAEPALLPAANLLVRMYVRHFSEILPKSSGFEYFFYDLMERVDTANAWEIAHCRARVEDSILHIPDNLPDYGNFDIKFYPAAGHVFGAVAMFVRLGYTVGSDEVHNLISYFQHYLVAMQINDDAHDWKEDMARGHISTAVSLILKLWRQKYPDKPEICLDRDMAKLEKIFWFDALPKLCESVLSHAALSRKALYALNAIEDPTPLERYITRNERIAQKAIDERARTDDLIQAFS